MPSRIHHSRVHRRLSTPLRCLGAFTTASWLFLTGLPAGDAPSHGASWRLGVVPPAVAKERRESSEKRESSEERESSEKEEHSEKEGGSSEFSHVENSKSEGGEGNENGRREAGSESRAYYRRGDEGGDGDHPPRTLVEMLERALGGGEPHKAESRERGLRTTGAGTIQPSAPIGHRGYANDEVLAVNLSHQDAARAQRLGFKVGGMSRMPHGGGSVTRLHTPPGMGALKGRDVLVGRVPGAQFALNRIYHPYHIANKDMDAEGAATVPARHGGLSVCTPERCYARQLIRWHDAMQPCAQGLRVGVIDTHIDLHHPAFANAALNVGGFIADDREAAPDWHGTGVLALLAGDPDSGTPGLIPSASFFVASVFFQDSEGEVATDTLSVLGALEWMDAFDVKVINMSFSGPKDPLVQRAIENMARRGVIFIAAVGNDGPTVEPAYPAAYEPVIAVTAVTKELRNYPYANRGDRIDIAAPGVNIWSAVPHAREGFHTGTSFAAPYVTAILATLYNSIAHGPKDELLNRLPIMDLGPSGRDPVYGRGLALAPTKCGLRDGTIAQAPEDQQPHIPRQPPFGWGASIAPDEEAAALR